MKEDEQSVISGEAEIGFTDESPNQVVSVWTEMVKRARAAHVITEQAQLANARIRANLAYSYLKYNK